MTISKDTLDAETNTGIDTAEKAESGEESAGPESKRSESRQPREIGGREGPEPTRYGDWEKNGRCIDF